MNYSCGECWSNPARSVEKISKCIFLLFCFIYLPNICILTPCCCFRQMEEVLKGRKKSCCLRAARLQGARGGLGLHWVLGSLPTFPGWVNVSVAHGPWLKCGGDGGHTPRPGLSAAHLPHAQQSAPGGEGTSPAIPM